MGSRAGVIFFLGPFSPNRVLSVGVLAAKIAPMGGPPGLARRRTVVFMILRGHDLTHSAAVLVAFFFVAVKNRSFE